MTSHREVVTREWLKMLGTLVCGSMRRAEAEARLSAYAPLLTKDFPEEAFSPESLAAVAREFKQFFPSYGEVWGAVNVWWRENLPATYRPLQPPPHRLAIDQGIPKPIPPPSQEAIDHVIRVSAALRSDLLFQASEREAAIATVRGRPTKPISYETLREIWREELRRGTPGAGLRIEMLTQKIDEATQAWQIRELERANEEANAR